MPGREAVSTLHWPKNEILSFFKFLLKKGSRLDKKNPAQFCILFGKNLLLAGPMQEFEITKSTFNV